MTNTIRDNHIMFSITYLTEFEMLFCESLLTYNIDIYYIYTCNMGNLTAIDKEIKNENILSHN